jgi:hypothetical protein
MPLRKMNTDLAVQVHKRLIVLIDLGDFLMVQKILWCDYRRARPLNNVGTAKYRGSVRIPAIRKSYGIAALYE